MSDNDLRKRLDIYARQKPIESAPLLHREDLASEAFTALLAVIDECERAWTDASPERRRVITNIRDAISRVLPDSDSKS